jgi:hypothetical protein
MINYVTSSSIAASEFRSSGCALFTSGATWALVATQEPELLGLGPSCSRVVAVDVGLGERSRAWIAGQRLGEVESLPGGARCGREGEEGMKAVSAGLEEVRDVTGDGTIGARAASEGRSSSTCKKSTWQCGR